MDDIDRNALIVNALQREAAIIVQNSLAEGFGLTVHRGDVEGQAGHRHRRWRNQRPDNIATNRGARSAPR